MSRSCSRPTTGEPCDPRANVGSWWRVAGENGIPLVVTGRDGTMQAAREQAYERWIDGDRLLARDSLGGWADHLYRNQL